ncbi:DUF3364 domain-containing protein, partial [Rhizobium leguminosarum]|uniref:DUF3364 domain-containing protein n=1 Tax=Rhizobium leguminosarum TaxID=384 RepID=UPI003F9BA949
MPQSAEKVLDHVPLFYDPEYEKMFARKKLKFECPHPDKVFDAQYEFTSTWSARSQPLRKPRRAAGKPS